jgi:hypothetical protein
MIAPAQASLATIGRGDAAAILANDNRAAVSAR